MKKIFNIFFLLCFILLFHHNAHADDAVTKILGKAQELAEKQKIKGKSLTDFITNNVITVDYEGEERSYKFNTDITYEVYVGGKIAEEGTWAIKGLTKRSIKLTGHQDLYIQIYKNKERISTLTNLKKKNDSQTNRKILKISSSSDFEKQLAQVELEKQKALEQKKKEEEKRLAKLKAEEEQKKQEEEEKRIAEEEKKLVEDEKKEEVPKTLEQKKKEIEERKQLLADKRKALEKKKGKKQTNEQKEEKIEVEEEKKLVEDGKKEEEQKTSKKFLELRHSKYITFDYFKNHFDGKVIELSVKNQSAFAFFKVDMSKYKPPNLITDFYWLPEGNMGMQWIVIKDQTVGIFVEPTHEGVVKKVYLCDHVEQRRCKPGGMNILIPYKRTGFGFVTIAYSKDATATLLDGTKTKGGYFLTSMKHVKKGEIQYEEDKLTFYSERRDSPVAGIALHDANKIKAIENACKNGKNFDGLPLVCARQTY